MTLGIENNNPGNLVANNTNWVGSTGSNDGFVTFQNPTDGVRALNVTLQTYQNTDGLNTVSDIITKYAPPGENDTQTYINNVSTSMGVDPNQPINVNDPATASALTKAIITQENGSQPYSDDVINNGVQAAITHSQAAGPVVSSSQFTNSSSGTTQKQSTSGSTTGGVDNVSSDSPVETNRIIFSNVTNQALFNQITPNVLNKYRNVTYHWSFFVCNPLDIDLYGQIMSSNSTSAAVTVPTTPVPVSVGPISTNTPGPTIPPDQVVTQTPKVIIAETGMTSFAIQNVTMQTTVGPNPASYTTTASTIDISILEPYGLTLYDKMVQANLFLNGQNWNSNSYYLLLTFKGYDEAGNFVDAIPVPNPASGSSSYLWRCIISNIQTSYEEGYFRHNVNLIPYEQLPFAKHYGDVIPFDKTSLPSNGSFASVMNTLAAAMTQAEKDNYGRPGNKYQCTFIPFVGIDGLPSIDFNTLSVNNQQKSSDTQMGYSIETDQSGQTFVTATRDTPINQYALYVASMCPQLQTRLLKGIKADGSFDIVGAIGNNQVDRWAYLLKMDCHTTILPDPQQFYDVVKKDYRYQITYVFRIVPIARTNKDPLGTDKMTPTDYVNRVGMFQRTLTMAKEYDYIYTGQNTEVINVDLTFNHLWQNITAGNFLGLASADINRIGAQVTKLNTNLTSGTLVSEIAQLSLKQTSLTTQLAQMKQQQATSDAASAASQAEQASLNQQVSSINTQSAVENSALTVAEGNQNLSTLQQRNALISQQKQQNNRFNGTFADNLNYNNTTIQNTIAGQTADAIVTGMQLRAATGSTTQNNLQWKQDMEFLQNRYNTKDNGRVWFSIVMDDLLTSSNELTTIDLKIKGDPFWLGIPNTDPKYLAQLLSSTTNSETITLGDGSNILDANGRPSFMSAENYILFRYNIPQINSTIGQSAYGTIANVQSSQVISGVYAVNTLISEWSEGEFHQTLSCIKEWNTLIDQNGTVTKLLNNTIGNIAANSPNSQPSGINPNATSDDNQFATPPGALATH